MSSEPTSKFFQPLQKSILFLLHLKRKDVINLSSILFLTELLIFFCNKIIDTALNLNIQIALSGIDYQSVIHLLNELTGALLYSLQSLLLLFYIAYKILNQEISFIKYIKINLSAFVLETIRVYGHLFFFAVLSLFVFTGLGLITANFIHPIPTVWLLLLILLSIAIFFNFYLRYYFVPCVVLIDKEYIIGSVDAMEKSVHILEKGYFWPLLILIFFSLIDMLRSSFEKGMSFNKNPLLYSSVYISTEFLAFFLSVLLFSIYQLRNESDNNSRRQS